MKKKKQQMLGNLEIAAFCDQLSMIVSAGFPSMKESPFCRRTHRKKKLPKFYLLSAIPSIMEVLSVMP